MVDQDDVLVRPENIGVVIGATLPREMHHGFRSFFGAAREYIFFQFSSHWNFRPTSMPRQALSRDWKFCPSLIPRNRGISSHWNRWVWLRRDFPVTGMSIRQWPMTGGFQVYRGLPQGVVVRPDMSRKRRSMNSQPHLLFSFSHSVSTAASAASSICHFFE